MLNQHPIIPPPELVEQWATDNPHQIDDETYGYEIFIATRAAQWGADRELEACCEWVSQWCGRWPDGTRPEDELRAARRPKQPSLKEQALAPFLALLERDIASHPERLQPIGTDLVRRLQDLVGGIEVDLDEVLPDDETIRRIRATRRPKPPSLKEEAIGALLRFMADDGHDDCPDEVINDDFNIIRRALEALPDD